MNDPIIRNQLKKVYLNKYIEDKHSIVIDEYNLSLGIVRADVAVFNGVSHGFEIKSERDSLVRLENQMLEYNKFFEYVTIVTCEKFIEKIIEIVPEHCGIIKAYSINENVKFKYIRRAKKNYSLDKLSLAKALWRDEILDILNSINYKKGFRSKSKPFLYNILCEEFSTVQLSKIVKEKLKNRTNWKVD